MGVIGSHTNAGVSVDNLAKAHALATKQNSKMLLGSSCSYGVECYRIGNNNHVALIIVSW